MCGRTSRDNLSLVKPLARRVSPTTQVVASKSMATTEKTLREMIVSAGVRLNESGLAGAPAGDISARSADSILITPNGAPYSRLRSTMIARMPLGGEYGAWSGPIKPSSEWRIHLDISRARPDVGAVVRFQSPFATALAMAHKPIPAAHSMIALFGASEIRCANYAPIGTKELAVLALEALGEGHAALLGNYGALTTGGTLQAALARAFELERLARLYAIVLSIGRPRVLSDEEVTRIGERIKASGVDIDTLASGEGAGVKANAKAKVSLKPRAKSKRALGKRNAKKKPPRAGASAINPPHG
jgi:L-fuculose-phosphate aldolase